MSSSTHAGLRQELKSAVGELCRNFPDTYWRALDGQRAYPEAFVQALTKAGYMATLIPEEYGGAGLGIVEAATILEEIHRSGGNAAACHAQMYVMGTLLRHGSETQKKKYLPALARGELRLQAFGVSEPTTGSDTTQMKTFARRVGDNYVVKGQKIWISRAEHSDLMLLVARTTPIEQVKKRSEGLSVLLVDLREARNHGLTIRPIRTMMNHATTEVFFDDVEVSAENLIGEEGQGFRYLLDVLNAERILIAAECIGDGRWFLELPAVTPKIASFLGGPLDRIRAFSSHLPALIPMSKLRRSWSKKPRRCSTLTSLAARKPTWPSCWRRMRPGNRPTPLCRHMAALVLRKNMT